MRLYHWTTPDAWRLIRRQGLDPAASQGARPLVWLAHSDVLGWALDHVCVHQQCEPHQMILIPVDVPLSWLRRVRHGVFTCDRVIPVRKLLRPRCRY